MKIALTSLGLLMVTATYASASFAQEASEYSELPQGVNSVDPADSTSGTDAAANGAELAPTDASTDGSSDANAGVTTPDASSAAMSADSQPTRSAKASLTPAAGPSLAGGDLRAPSPKILDESRKGYFQLGAGLAYGLGFESDSVMYNVQGSYNLNVNDRVSGKALLDTYLGTGGVSSRMINVGLGGDVYLPEINPMTEGIPYITADLAIGNGRNALEETNAGLSLGAGAGFKFQAQDLNWDISANYSLLTAQIGNTNPSTLAARAAVSF